MEKSAKTSNKVPPDGGWGWMIVVANAVSSLAMIPIIQTFGLVFKDRFAVLGLSATDSSIIINVNVAFGMVLGLINGPLLKRFGYRKIAIVGSIINSIGITWTAFADSFALFIISYGILASAGMGLAMSALSLAFNSYFTTKRSRAMGLCMTIIGLGPIYMPQVTSLAMSYYGLQGTVLLYGSYSLHSLIGAMLLQPVKWHMKEKPIPSQSANESVTVPEEKSKNIDIQNSRADDEESVYESAADLTRLQRIRRPTVSSIDHDAEVGSIYGFDTPLPRQLSQTLRTVSQERDIDDVSDGRPQIRTNRYPIWNTGKSIESINLGSSVKIFEEGTVQEPLLNNNFAETKKLKQSQDILQKEYQLPAAKNGANFIEIQDSDTKSKKKRTRTVQVLHRIAAFYDLGLLRDPIYVNIMLGMSIAIFAEINFSMLTPFILADMNLSTGQIATVLSTVATIDLISRGVSPYIGEWMNQPARNMYMYSLVLLIISRTTLTFTTNFSSIMVVAVGLGAAKGIRSVYMTLVVPSYVSIQRLPYASGIQMVVNGVFLMLGGPFLGVIRDAVGSYIPCINIINTLTAVTVMMWTTEIIILRRKKSRKLAAEKQEEIIPRKC